LLLGTGCNLLVHALDIVNAGRDDLQGLARLIGKRNGAAGHAAVSLQALHRLAGTFLRAGDQRFDLGSGALVRRARPRTSSATTAKPRPASPARAASMAALSASRLVCSATERITVMMLLICSAEAHSCCTASVRC
jgi:hypothetical protein